MPSEPTLYARMELRLTDFERKLARATKSTDQTMARIERRGNQMTAKLSGIGSGAFSGLIKGAALALAPLLSVGAAVSGAKVALEQFGSISDSAKAGGIDAEFFQGLAYQAGLAGVGVDSLAGSLATFNRNSGLADAGTGRMVTALMKLNPALLENIRNATTQEQRIRLAVDAIVAAGSASEKAALSVALFGDNGTKLVDAFSGGSSAIDAMASRARDLGLIVDRDLIARADELGDQFDTVTQIVDVQLKAALVDLGPTLIWLTQLAGGLASTIGYAVQQMKAASDQTSGHLEERLEWLQNNGVPVTSRGGTAAVEAAKAQTEAEMAQIQAELRRRAIENLKSQLAAPEMISLTQPEDAPIPGLSGSSGGGNAAANTAIAHGEAVQKLIADLQFEKQVIGETALEQEILNTLRNAGVDAASAEGLAIRNLVTELDAQKTAIAAAADAMREFEGIATNALSSFISDLREGKSGAEALGNVMNSILDSVIQIGIQSLVGGLFGGGGLLGGLGSLFGFADGGYTGAGGKNEPAGVVHKGEVVWSQRDIARAGGVGVVEAMRRGMAGYANGGFVGSPGPVTGRPANDNGALTVRVELDSEMLHAQVVNTAGRVVAAAAPTIVRRANDNAPDAVAQNAARFGS